MEVVQTIHHQSDTKYGMLRVYSGHACLLCQSANII